MPARFGLDQHGYVRQCKRLQTVPCRAGPARIHTRGLARHGTVVAASVNANRAGYRALAVGVTVFLDRQQTQHSLLS